MTKPFRKRRLFFVSSLMSFVSSLIWGFPAVGLYASIPRSSGISAAIPKPDQSWEGAYLCTAS
jgi:hypothetical protein